MPWIELCVLENCGNAYSSTTINDTNYTKYYYDDLKGNITDVKTFLYGEDDYTDVTIPSFYIRNWGNYSADMYYNGIKEYDDIYNLNIGQTPSLTFTYFDSLWQSQITGMTTTMTYNNLDINTEGYYYRLYTGTDSNNYDVDFKIVFKVGNPTGGPTIPQEHVHYSYDSSWLDQMSGYGTIDYVNGVAQTEVAVQDYTYDNQGNPTNITNFIYDGITYNHAALSYDGRQLTEIKVYNSSLVLVDTITYTYNDQGYRTSKTVGGVKTEYHLQGDKVLLETNGTYAIIYTYDYDGQLISFNYDSNKNDTIKGIEYYYIRNIQGDITKIIDKNGAIVVEYTYDTWGKLLNIDGSLASTIGEANPYRYRGYRYDEEISLYYLNSRFYDANIGRFINADGLLGQQGNMLGHNMYAYTQNNPVMYVDPSGEFPILLLLAGISVATLASSVIVGRAYNKAAKERLSFSTNDFSTCDLTNEDVAKIYMDYLAKQDVYENVYTSTGVFNGLKLIVQSLASIVNADALVAKTLKPGFSMIIDLNINEDAIYHSQNNGFDLTQQDTLSKYYIERYYYWRDNYNE